MVCRLRFIVDMFAWFPFDWIVLAGALHTASPGAGQSECTCSSSCAAQSQRAMSTCFLMPAAFDASISDNFHRWIGLIQLLRLVRMQCACLHSALRTRGGLMQSKDAGRRPKTEGLLPWLESCTSWWNTDGSLEHACIIGTARCVPLSSADLFSQAVAYIVLLQPFMRTFQLQLLHNAAQDCFS